MLTLYTGFFPINALAVLAGPIGLYTLLTHFFEKGQHFAGAALGHKRHHGNATAAGGLYEINLQYENLSGTRHLRKMLAMLIPAVLARMDGLGASINPQDEGLAFKGAEHQRHARVFAQVRRRFIAAARKIEPDNLGLAHHAQRREPLGRKIDTAIGCAVATKNIGCALMKATSVAFNLGPVAIN